MSNFYNDEELAQLGFKSVGRNNKISKKTSFYNTSRIELGNDVRIDDFCVISACAEGFVKIGNRVHIAAHCFIEAPAGVTLEDFSGLAARCTIYGGSDDYGGEYLTNPCVPLEFRKCTNKHVHIKKHAVIGTGSTILFGVTIGAGSAVGSMAFVTKSIPDSAIAIGIPAKVVKKRSAKLFELEEQLLKKQ
ncbi:acyltransferase [Rheinheimera salexigens]|uniref:Galactoside O-acetyltransferase n=1 Tax=Rheinheimera salexigens TaxID=1628148 RepID=A0A1E7Q4T9_9GAMM|nr:acyltransferase [Rheinheimera salexigens]OEY69214.1 galactoside O-acetyltransferase [Rheinheimera salexigens]